MNKPEIILIDLDGTLVDSVPDLAWCIDRMMEQLGGEPHGEQRVREWVGNGVEWLVRRALANAQHGEVDAAELARACPLFMALYAENTTRRSSLYAGVREGLDQLRQAGYLLGCVTNKVAQFTEPLLRHLGLFDDFSIIVSGDTLASKKPDPAQLLHAAEVFKCRPERSLMIGDSVSDVRAARAAGFRIICTSYGYNHGMDIREARPDAVVDSMLEIFPLLEQAA